MEKTHIFPFRYIKVNFVYLDIFQECDKYGRFPLVMPSEQILRSFPIVVPAEFGEGIQNVVGVK